MAYYRLQLSPRKLSVSAVLRDGVWTNPVSVAISCCVGVNNFYLWKPLSTPRILTAQLHTAITEVIPGGPEDSHGDGNTFPGSGNDYHWSAQQQTDTLAHEAELVHKLGYCRALKFQEQNPVGGK